MKTEAGSLQRTVLELDAPHAAVGAGPAPSQGVPIARGGGIQVGAGRVLVQQQACLVGRSRSVRGGGQLVTAQLVVASGVGGGQGKGFAACTG